MRTNCYPRQIFPDILNDFERSVLQGYVESLVTFSEPLHAIQHNLELLGIFGAPNCSGLFVQNGRYSSIYVNKNIFGQNDLGVIAHEYFHFLSHGKEVNFLNAFDLMGRPVPFERMEGICNAFRFFFTEALKQRDEFCQHISDASYRLGDRQKLLKDSYIGVAVEVLNSCGWRWETFLRKIARLFHD